MKLNSKNHQIPSSNSNTIQVSLASFWKRLLAWIYDLLGAMGVVSLAFVIGYLVVYLVTLYWIVNTKELSQTLSNNPFWMLYLAASVQYYYVWCWVKGGQTVGMRTWRLKLCKPDGSFLSWQEGYIRSFCSLGGIGSLWAIFDKDQRGWQDIVVGSLVVQLPKPEKINRKPII